jgi:succinoglycan biosynthesis protein ExoA
MSSTVFVSVVMPVRNEESFIAESLGAVLQQDYPSESMEILVADGASDDRTLEIIRSLSEAGRVRVVSNPQRVQAAGLNKALLQARGEIILRVDGHTIIAPDYIRQCVKALAETGAWGVGGAIAPVGRTPLGKVIAAATTSAFAVPGAFHVGHLSQYTDTVYMGAWPRWVLDRVGGFDEGVCPNEDYELNYRIRQAGGKIYFSPAIRSSYFGRQTIRGLARQYFNYGRAKTRTLRKHPASLRLRQLVPPGFIVALLAGPLLAFMAPSLIELWLAVPLAYLTMNMVFSVRVARRMRGGLLQWIPFVFAVIHIIWGLGFWIGWLPSLFPFAHHLPASHRLSQSDHPQAHVR